MASNKTLLERCLPLLFALVVLISSLPVLPAAAAEDPVDPNAIYTVSGTWIFNQYVTVPDSAIVQFVSFFSDGINYSYMRFLPTGIRYVADSEDSGVTVTEAQLFDGKFTFLNPEYRTVSFDSTQVVSQSFYQYLISNAVKSEDYQDPDPGDQTAVLQAGQWECNSLVMTGEYVDLTPWPDGLASVQMNFSSGDQDYNEFRGQYSPLYGDCVYYDNTLVYKYSDLTGTAAASWQNMAYALVYLVDDQEVPQAFYDWFTANFSRLGSDIVPPSYFTTVNIYDSTGLVLLHSIKFNGSDGAPVSTLTVTHDGCTISCGQLSTTWTAGDSAFSGFAMSAASGVPIYQPGSSYTLPGGEKSDLVINLYVVKDDGSAGDAGEAGAVLSGFADFLIKPVMAFFNVEFIPGFSFGKIALVAFLLGLVFWFLKVSK